MSLVQYGITWSSIDPGIYNILLLNPANFFFKLIPNFGECIALWISFEFIHEK